MAVGNRRLNQQSRLGLGGAEELRVARPLMRIGLSAEDSLVPRASGQKFPPPPRSCFVTLGPFFLIPWGLGCVLCEMGAAPRSPMRTDDRERTLLCLFHVLKPPIFPVRQRPSFPYFTHEEIEAREVRNFPRVTQLAQPAWSLKCSGTISCYSTLLALRTHTTSTLDICRAQWSEGK